MVKKVLFDFFKHSIAKSISLLISSIKKRIGTIWSS